ncbi:hypothetical protein AWC38_SpisGene10037 [Stylophora pistillata]|uniref:Secreted protein n=1 Tax=Stylophora pistillata TaxID=50429 RepID=A0A2B4SA11_STYPI|nr:hypothetical protein AWC38_SpisGene10037 [Stylophora pistillata]
MKTSTSVSTLCFFIILCSSIQVSDAYVMSGNTGNVGKRFVEHNRNIQDIRSLAEKRCGSQQQARDMQAESKKLQERDFEFSH